MSAKTIALIGAGVVGLTSAYELHRAGHKVTLFEAADEVALGASYGNAGLISAASAEAWSSPGAVWAALRWLFKADAPLKVHLRWDWERLKWLGKFALEARNYEANTKALTHMALAARAPLQNMAEKADLNFDLGTRGVLDLYGDEKERDQASKVVGWMRDVGLERTFVEPHELRQLEPSLPKDWAFATHCASDLTGDSNKLCQGLKQMLEEEGATFKLASPVTSLKPSSGQVLVETSTESQAFDRAIVANGLEANSLARHLGDRLDLYGVKGYSLTLDLNGEQLNLAPRHGLLDHKSKIAVSTLGSRLRVAGTAEIGAKDLRLSPARIQPLKDWVRRTLPALADAPTQEWAGFRPMRAQIQPLLQKSRASDCIIYNIGHGHLGWTLATASAQRLAAMID